MAPVEPSQAADLVVSDDHLGAGSELERANLLVEAAVIPAECRLHVALAHGADAVPSTATLARAAVGIARARREATAMMNLRIQFPSGSEAINGDRLTPPACPRLASPDRTRLGQSRGMSRALNQTSDEAPGRRAEGGSAGEAWLQ